MCYKVMTNKVRLNKEKFFSLSNNKTRGHIYTLHKTRGHIYKLHKNQQAIKQSWSQSFAIRSINDWNSLPSSVVQAELTFHFKKQLEKHRES